MDNPIKQAISQHSRNQQEDRIRKLYFYAQILLSCAVNEAKYGTNGTPENFWSDWKEKEIETEEIETVKNRVPAEETRKKIMAQRQSSKYFNKEQAQLISSKLTKEFTLTQQDILLLSVASPMRLLDLVSNFILYDKGVKKIARYQQYFAVKNAMRQVTGLHSNPRPGGVIWHTQGSGKSLTMGLMAEAIARDETIKNPKIILVTDRTDLDKQITSTFRNIGLEVLNAKSGKNLVEILQSNTDAVVTTIINKFESAINRIKEPLEGNNIFVLVDEGHRTQHGTFNINMQKTMPNACYIAFTGTPLFKKDKSTMRRFGKMIDQYTVKQAVADGAVLPLVYEGRYTKQEVNKNVIDNYFQMVSEDLSDYEKVDLKKKFSQRSHIADADQNIYGIAWDITKHYQENFQGTGLKGQLICSTKRTAVKYYNYLKQIGKVSVALIISPPDDREGEESAYTSTSEDVKKFWSAMMDQHANSKKYEENTISHFKHEAHPEIIIVVDKLLTGFDAPRNTVLYLTRKLRAHTLLQAIARVNRLFPDKDYGYIVDYAGVVEELDDALLTYSDMEEFDEKDLEGTLTSIQDEVESLDPAHQELLDIFKQIKNKEDLELYQQTLREKDVRDDFYKRLANYARILKLALSSIEFHNKTNEKKIDKYKADLKFFMNLRTAVAQRFSDRVDYKQYEGQIQKLIDQHIATQGVEQLTELVNIFDEKDLEGTLTSIQDEVESLDPAHQELLDIFKQIKNKEDLELYQQTLREKDVRDDFYKRLANYARILKLALSSIEFHNKTNEKKIDKYKADLKFFMNLRTAVAQRFSDRVDYKQYEGQIQKLIDQHIATQGVEQLTELVNIFDEEAFQKEVEKTVGEAAKADKIASRTSKHISEKMDEDPVFYRKFSHMIQQAINDFYDERISELEYLNRIKDYREKVLTRTDSEIPEKIRHNPTASAYYGIVQSFYKDKDVSTSDYEDLLIEASLQTQEIIEARKVVNWRNNQDVLKKMVLNIGDYIYDEIGEKIGTKISFSDVDRIADEIVSVAKTRG